MILDSNTVKWLSPEGLEIIKNTLVTGLERQLKDNWDGEDLEFEDCCKGWSEALQKAKTPYDFGRIFDDLNKQAGDIYGTEGWEKGLGLPT